MDTNSTIINSPGKAQLRNVGTALAELDILFCVAQGAFLNSDKNVSLEQLRATQANVSLIYLHEAQAVDKWAGWLSLPSFTRGLQRLEVSRNPATVLTALHGKQLSDILIGFSTQKEYLFMIQAYISKWEQLAGWKNMVWESWCVQNIRSVPYYFQRLAEMPLDEVAENYKPLFDAAPSYVKTFDSCLMKVVASDFTLKDLKGEMKNTLCCSEIVNLQTSKSVCSYIPSRFCLGIGISHGTKDLLRLLACKLCPRYTHTAFQDVERVLSDLKTTCAEISFMEPYKAVENSTISRLAELKGFVFDPINLSLARNEHGGA